MRRPASKSSIDEILRNALEPVLMRASAGIASAVADLAAARLDGELRRGLAGRRGRVRRSGRGRGRRAELTRWVADRRARRVPRFVIEMTNGLDTKRKIVARYGAGAAFEKGKPPPSPK